jgi:CBS domain-containing protein
MPKAFDANNPPFDRLTPLQMDRLRASLDIGYFRPDEQIIGQGAAADHLVVVIKGQVEERDGTEPITMLGPKDSFDARAIMHGTSPHAFVAREETLCYLLPKATTLALINDNPRFASFFYLEMSRKLDAASQDEDEARAGSFMRARVKDVFLHPADFITADDTIETAGKRMQAINSNALFVRDGNRTGIITGMNLSKAVVLQRQPITAPVRAYTHFEVVALTPDDFVFSALLAMTKHNKRRVAVKDGDTFVGILEDIDLLSFLGGSAQLIAGRIERAANLSDLAGAAREIDGQVRVLRRQGLKIEVISQIVSDLNRRLMAKLFGMVAPDIIREKGCLIVMGSEGRGEQSLRTDQDNGLILAGPVDENTLNAFRRDFTNALESFGFPACPGNVMVRNALWSKTVDDYVAEFRRWVTIPDQDSHMNVAIFFDAEAVAGNVSLLARAKEALVEMIKGEQVYLAHFARAVEFFPTPIGLFNKLITSEGKGDALDLKKGGIFPIVHGIRSFSIERGIVETSTVKRIAKLAEAGALSVEFARELTQALLFLMTLRLDRQLAATKGLPGSLVRPAELSSMERDLLRDAFQVVKQFREINRRHFNLSLF